MHITRREFAKYAGGTLAGVMGVSPLLGQPVGDRPKRDKSVQVLNPLGRVPMSLIIDDSTCLVNLNRFAIPQFDASFGKGSKYKHDWKSWPHEIPDKFVRKFGDWAKKNGVKGKYSIVPFPACVGRLDRGIPGWSPKELASSIELVQKHMMPDWDIHPEMVTHTRVIDTKTGHPYPERSLKFMENWRWTDGKSVEELTDYLSYALRILKNVDLPCEGITTPGGFGNRVLPQLARATLNSCRDVFGAEIPHYFRHVYSSGERSVAPVVQYASGLDTDDPKCVVSVIACTGDWTGGWDCSNRGNVDLFITNDLEKGRLVEVIDRGEPCILLCHWTGVYFNGEEVGLKIFDEAVRRTHEKYDNLIWMKLAEISRYWAAKELTTITRKGNAVELNAPFASPRFTVRIATKNRGEPKLTVSDKRVSLTRKGKMLALEGDAWFGDDKGVVVCFDLPKGKSRIEL